jgi:hypothetical protein
MKRFLIFGIALLLALTACEADYNEAVRIDPGYTIAYQNLAVLHREIGERHLGFARDYQRKAGIDTSDR